MTLNKYRTLFLRRHIAIPQDHGSWVFVLSPLIIGLFAGENFSISSLLLVVSVMMAFLIRQPITIAVKIFSGRRPRRELNSAIFWVSIYCLIGMLALTGLILQGFGYLLYLVVPGVVVFTWHLYLVSRRAERNQPGIEIVASGVLALSAPAAMWVGLGYPNVEGWLLFVLLWLQSAGSIVYAYLRLEQRKLTDHPAIRARLKMGSRALIYNSFNLILVLGLSFATITPKWLPVAYSVQWIETFWGSMVKPAVGEKPTRIGIRQLFVSILFTIVFIIALYL